MADRIPFEAFEPPATTPSQIDDIMKAVVRGPVSASSPGQRWWIPTAAVLAIAAAIALLLVRVAMSEGPERAERGPEPESSVAIAGSSDDEQRAGAARVSASKSPQRSKTRPARDKATPAPARDLSSLSKAARAAFLRQDYASALGSCTIVLERDPDATLARRVCAYSACHLGLVGLAEAHIDELPGPLGEAALEQCRDRGLEIGVPDDDAAQKTPIANDRTPALLAKARRAAMSGQYGVARNACETILKSDPANMDARTICLVAACALKRTKAARRHYRRLPAARKGWATHQCSNHGIDVP